MATPFDTLGLFSYLSLDKAAQSRARFPFVLTLLPGAPPQRAAIATVAVGTQARAAVRREQQVAADVVSAVEAITKGTPAAEAFAAQPALRDLDTAGLAVRFEKTIPPVKDDAGRPATKAELEMAAAMVVAAIGMAKNTRFTQTEAKPYKAFISKLDEADRDKIIKP